MSLLYGIFVTLALLGAGYWIHKNYSNTRERHGNINWHRLIANNVYLAILRLPIGISWEIKISIVTEQVENISMVVEEKKHKVEIWILKGASLDILKEFVAEVNPLDPAIKLFLEGMTMPAIAAPLFPHQKDYEVYKELVFYLKTSLDR